MPGNNCFQIVDADAGMVEAHAYEKHPTLSTAGQQPDGRQPGVWTDLSRREVSAAHPLSRKKAASTVPTQNTPAAST